MTTKTVETEQTLLPLAPEAPPDLTHGFFDVSELEFKEHPRPNLALRQSVKNWGVMKPVLVHQVGDGSIKHPIRRIVVDGNRRCLAAKEADVKVHGMLTGDLGYLKSVATIMLNETGDKNPLAVMEALDQLIEAGYGEKAIAEKTGMSVATVRKRLKLRKVIPEIREMIASGKVAPGIAEKIAKLSAREQVALYEKAKPTEDGQSGKRITADAVHEVRSVDAQAALATLPGGFFDDAPEGEGPTVDNLAEMERRIVQIRAWLKSTGIPVKTFVDHFNKAGRTK